MPSYVPVSQRAAGGTSAPAGGTGGGAPLYVPVSQRTAAAPAPAPKKGGVAGFLDSVGSLFGGSKPKVDASTQAAQTPTTPTYVPVSQRASSTPEAAPAPAEPSTLSKVGSGASHILGKVSDAISKATSAPETLPSGGTSAFKNTMAYLPSEIVRHLPFGIGATISQIQDDPETAAKIGFKDVAKEVPGQVLEAGKQFVKMPVQGALDAYGAGAQAITNGKYNGQVHFEIPGLGEISNAQFRAASRVAQGEDPAVVALEEGAGSIFETLFFADIASRPFVGRSVKTAEFKVDGGRRVETDSGALSSGAKAEIVKDMPPQPADFGPKSFRLYEKPVVNTPLPPEIVARMQSQGIDLGPKFDPDMPTYFRVSPGPKGTVIGEVIQVKPSIFSVLQAKLAGQPKGPFTETPGTGDVALIRQHIKHSEAFDVEKAIANGDIPEGQVYSDPASKTLTPTFAQGRITDIATKLDQYKPGLGDEFRGMVDPSKSTLASLEQTGMDVLDKHVVAEGRSTPVFRYEGGEKGAAFQKVKDISGDGAATVGAGKYYAYDPESSSFFGDNLHQYQMPKDLNLYDATKGAPNDPTGFSGLDGDPLYRKGLVYSKGDMLAQAAKDGYDGVIFFADDGVNRWVGLNGNAKLPEGVPPPVKTPPPPALAGFAPKETATIGAGALANLPKDAATVLYQRHVDDKAATEAGSKPVYTPPSTSANTPASAEDAAQQYQQQVIDPAVKAGQPVVIGGDDLKDHFGGDYNDTNHPIYSKAAFQLYEKALKDTPDDGVVFIGGGPGSGKTEILVNQLRQSGFKGIIYDSNLSNLEGAIKQIEMAKQANKQVRIYGITPDLESARMFTILREGEKGRGISDNTFARGHSGFPNVAAELIRRGIISAEDVRIVDTRSPRSLQEVKDSVAAGAFVPDPLAHVSSLGYSEDHVRNTYAKHLFDGKTGRRLQDAGVREGASAPSREDGSNRSDAGGSREYVPVDARGSGDTGVSAILKKRAKKVDEYPAPGPLSEYAAELAKARADEESSKAEPGTYFFVQNLMKYQEEMLAQHEPRVAEVLGELSDSPEAKQDWEDHYADDAAALSARASAIDKEVAALKGKENAAKKQRLIDEATKINRTLSQMEEDFIRSWKNKAEQVVLDEIKGKEEKPKPAAPAAAAVPEEKPAPKKEAMPVQRGMKKFDAIVMGGRHAGKHYDTRFVPHQGKQVELDTPGQFVVHRPIRAEGEKAIPGDGWVVSEATTGMTLFSGSKSTQKAAIEEANSVLKKVGPDGLTKALEKAKESYGELKRPSGGGMSTGIYADRGAFAENVPVKSGSLQKINPIELPEMVDLARELMGAPPAIKKKLGKALGWFKPQPGTNGKIELRADQFDDVEQVSKLLAHELGHLTDYLPDQTMKRGNLLGRLFTLKRFMGSTFNKESGKAVALDKLRTRALNEVLEENGMTRGQYMESKDVREELKPAVKERYTALLGETNAVRNDTIKAELMAVSDYWRPWDRTKAPESFIKYRESAAELYADSISMLFNSPGLLEEMAPTFYKEFFNALDAKPEVRDAYFELQSLLSGDRDMLIKARREGVQKMFQDGDLKALELQREKIEERKMRNSNVIQRLKHELIDKNASIIKRVADLEKQGVFVNPDENPVYYLEERNYLGGLIKYTAEDFNAIYQDMHKAGIPWDQFGERLFYERIAGGDRSDQANPRGITPAAAKELLETQEKELGPKAWKELDKGIADFRAVMRRITDDAYNEGLYSKELYDNMTENPSYAAFQVLDHLETQVSHKVFKSIGTFKDIANPADATILKTMATIRAIERNKVHRTTIDFLEKNFPGDSREADKRFSGKSLTYVDSKDPKEELVFVYREGKAIGYYVDPYVAGSLRNESIGQNLAVLTAFRYMNSYLFRPLFIAFSPGFQAFNFLRDFQRFWKNVPGMSLARTVQLYRKSIPMAKVRAFGLSETPSPAELKAYEEMRSLEHDQVFSMTYNDVMDGAPDDEKQIERILRQSGIESFQETKPALRAKALKPFVAVLELIKRTGDLIETLPKAAGYYEMLDQNSGAPLTREQRSYIRKYLGSPDFLAGGALKPATNEIFLFSNAIAQGIRSDIAIMSGPKTRSGYWWKTAKVNILPHLLMLAAALGFFGKEVKDIMDSATEYDKTNYTIIPLGHDSTTGKAVYMRFPADETGRLVQGLVWKILTAPTNTQPIGTDLTNLVSFTGGQLPNVSPAITAATAALQYASGQNPYDSFRGRNVISDDVFKAGGWRSLKSFMGWEFQELGGGTFMKFYNEPTAPKLQGPTEKFLGLPVISNVLGRFIRATDYGKTETLRGISDQTASKAAESRLDDNDIVNAQLKQALQDPNIGMNRGVYEASLRDQIKGEGPFDQAAQDRYDRARTRFRLGLIRGTADAETSALLNATTNKEKADILVQIKSETEDAAFQQYVAELRRSGVITPDVINKMTPSKP